MKFPYGISDFKTELPGEGRISIVTGLIKSVCLKIQNPSCLSGPVRFGKSLVLSMLENYYDVAKKDEFDSIFGKVENREKPHGSSQFVFQF